MKKSDENIAGFFRWTTQANPLSINHVYNFSCVYPVKLKNLKANHNSDGFVGYLVSVVYIP